MKKVCRKCNQVFVTDVGFEHQNYCRACFASLKENTRSPPRSLPNSGVGVALLDSSGTRLAPSLEARKLVASVGLRDLFEERAKLLEKSWFRVSFIESEDARERAAVALFLSEVRR